MRNLFSEFDNLPLHLRVATPLADPLEVRLDLAFEFQPSAPCTYREGILNDIAAKLLILNWSVCSPFFALAECRSA